jgi:5-formaminoimidazole-4-carboxamide-1-beta-D-ribofuranosyl 5'-monophosphate synthetase
LRQIKEVGIREYSKGIKFTCQYFPGSIRNALNLAGWLAREEGISWV